jgi:EmrB/QacA subfamily drug resistance transporter
LGYTYGYMNRRQFFVLLATVIGSGIVILDGTVVNLALPNITHHLHASFADLQWVIDAYLLTLSSLLLVGGALGDVFGKKRVYLIGLVGFGVSSLLCGLAWNIQSLIGLRGLQGIFGALLVPGALAIINTNFSDDGRGRAIGRWAAWSGIAAAVGPLLGGYLIFIASWRWIFFINVPFVAVCGWLAKNHIEESKPGRKHQIDIAGATTTALALGALTYGLIEGPAQHWNGRIVGMLAASAGLFLIFVFTEMRHHDPMIPLRLFRSRNFVGANLATFAMYGALSGFFFALVIYLQNTLGYTSLKAGVSLLPITVLLLVLSGKMGQLAGKYGPRLFMTAGPLVATLGMITLIHLHNGAAYFSGVFPGILLFGIGLSLTVAPLTSAVMAAVRSNDSGVASGVNNAVSRAAGLVIIALLGLLGAANSYKFSVMLCAFLTGGAGILSFVIIRNKPRKA